jgi:AcrR family transcriptional regulator
MAQSGAPASGPERGRAFVRRARSLSGATGTKSAEVQRGVLGERALRTRDQLIQTAVGLFMERGYGGTTIDHVARAAGMSRASFYSYFPSKREILLAAGHRTSLARKSAITALASIPDRWTRGDIEAWLRRYFAFLDEHGAFQLVWSQAAWFDPELRAMGVKGSLHTAAIIGRHLRRLGALGATTVDGLAVQSMLERFWYVWKKTEAPFKEHDVIGRLGRLLQSQLRSAA